MVRIHKNARGQTPSVVTATPVTTQSPEPQPHETPKKTTPPKSKVHKSTAKYLKPASMTRKPRSGGFGLFCCGNCRWFSRPFKTSTTHGCEQEGIKSWALPCALNVHGYGYFDPINMGKAGEFSLESLGPDELAILGWRARKLMVEKLDDRIREFRIGQKVQFLVNEERHPGAVVRITKRQVYVEGLDGTVLSLKPDLVFVDNAPTAASGSTEDP